MHKYVLALAGNPLVTCSIMRSVQIEEAVAAAMAAHRLRAAAKVMSACPVHHRPINFERSRESGLRRK